MDAVPMSSLSTLWNDPGFHLQGLQVVVRSLGQDQSTPAPYPSLPRHHYDHLYDLVTQKRKAGAGNWGAHFTLVLLWNWVAASLMPGPKSREVLPNPIAHI